MSEFIRNLVWGAAAIAGALACLVAAISLIAGVTWVVKTYAMGEALWRLFLFFLGLILLNAVGGTARKEWRTWMEERRSKNSE